MKRWITILLMLALAMPTTACAAQGTLRVDFYDVGKADAMLITTPAGHRILIDAGTNKAGKALVERLEQEGIDRIDMMIITHYDKDHVGGADKVLESIDVGEVVMPVYEKESKQFEQFSEAIDEAGVKAVGLKARQSMTATSGDVTLLISAAHRTSYGADEENDFSLAVRMTYGDTRFLFAGDAEDARQRELLSEGDVACDVLKVPYHGRDEDVTPLFLAEAAPKIAFIPDSEKEPASQTVVDLLVRQGAEVFCAKDGGVTVFSDGKTVRAQPGGGSLVD